MTKDNSQTIITDITQRDGNVYVKAITLSHNREDGKFVIIPSDVVPEEHWGKLLDNNRFEYAIYLKD